MGSTGVIRDQSIDVAKGVAIIAIVLGHVLRGLATSGIIDSDGAAFQTADRLIYMAHLSVFALLSGLFVRQGIEKRGQVPYLRNRMGLFLYLYIVWELLQGFSALILDPEGRAIGTVLSLWRPDSQMWFFGWLILMTVTVVLLRPWGSSTRVSAVLLIVSAVSLVQWGSLGVYFGLQGIALAIFFFVGAAIGQQRYRVALNLPYMAVVGVVCALLYVILTVWFDAVPPTTGGTHRDAPGVALGVIASFAAVVAVAIMSRHLARIGIVASGLGFAGRRSLEIFVAHIFALNAARVVLDRIGIDSPALHIVAGTAAGVLLPLLLWWVILKKIGFRYLFDAPDVLTGNQGSTKAVTARL
ncbi:acyltransferase family protein [Rhodococcus gordoniae]|uniref:acyltransferase family protein n=1 Tax=Rhodococcus gordoniae TaxID=223392 RepID=UPI003523189E